MARDRKRAKQRRERRARGAHKPSPASPAADQGPAGADATAGSGEPAPNGVPTPADLPSDASIPGALEHASAEVDEFDAALVRGASGVPAAPDDLSEGEIEAEALAEGDLSRDELQDSGGPGRTRPGGGGGDGGVSAEQASGAPIRKGNRALGFIRASWAELQRVQWPDRRQVTQATAVVLGFVAIAGAYLGLADFVAKEIVEFIL